MEKRKQMPWGFSTHRSRFKFLCYYSSFWLWFLFIFFSLSNFLNKSFQSFTLHSTVGVGLKSSFMDKQSSNKIHVKCADKQKKKSEWRRAAKTEIGIAPFIFIPVAYLLAFEMKVASARHARSFLSWDSIRSLPHCHLIFMGSIFIRQHVQHD